MKAKLKKYSPLGLLALAIVAGVVAVTQHQDDLLQHQENEDAGYDVITYLNCEDEDMLLMEMVIISFHYRFSLPPSQEHNPHKLHVWISKKTSENQQNQSGIPPVLLPSQAV